MRRIVVALGLVALAALPAHAVTFTFHNITNTQANLSGQLSVEVTEGAVAGTVDFTFYNNVGIASSITDIYFDDGTLLALASVTNSPTGTVSFTQQMLGNNVTPPD